jgi:hypothetical protein
VIAAARELVIELHALGIALVWLDPNVGASGSTERLTDELVERVQALAHVLGGAVRALDLRCPYEITLDDWEAYWVEQQILAGIIDPTPTAEEWEQYWQRFPDMRPRASTRRCA